MNSLFTLLATEVLNLGPRDNIPDRALYVEQKASSRFYQNLPTALSNNEGHKNGVVPTGDQKD
jgi:hypothetical protein